jgi:two-component system sensor histidine kinase/response regulator
VTNRRQISLCRKRWTGYAFALATPSLAIWLRLAFGYRAGDTPLLVVLLIPIMLSVYAGGFWPGIVATAVAGLEASYYLLPPIHSFATDGAYTVDLLALIFVGVFSTFWVEALKRNLVTL